MLLLLLYVGALLKVESVYDAGNGLTLIHLVEFDEPLILGEFED
jgi:hypothetical protein